MKKQQIFNAWYKCPKCHISQSFGGDFDQFVPKCPDCNGEMVKE